MANENWWIKIAAATHLLSAQINFGATCLQVSLKLKSYIKEHRDRCLTITHVSAKESQKNWINIRWTLKENINTAIRLIKLLNVPLNILVLWQIFELRLCTRHVREQYKPNLYIPRKKQVAFGTKSFRGLSPKIQNNIPYHIKSAENSNIIKDIVKWNGFSCSGTVFSLTYDKYNIIL